MSISSSVRGPHRTRRAGSGFAGFPVLLSNHPIASIRLSFTARTASANRSGVPNQERAQARKVSRTVEEDPGDFARARTFMSVYLLGLRDATRKFADLYGRTRDTDTLREYEALLSDLETSFTTHRTDLLTDNRSDLDIEIEVLRERLQQDGLVARVETGER